MGSIPTGTTKHFSTLTNMNSMTKAIVKYTGKSLYEEFNDDTFPEGSYFQFDKGLYLAVEWVKNQCRVWCFDNNDFSMFTPSFSKEYLKISKVDITYE